MSKSLYNPQFEHDSCGVGCITNFKGTSSHSIVKDALTMLENMEHRGATGSDPDTGDGAGILIQIPHDFLKEQLQTFGVQLPKAGLYGVGMIFYPQHYATRELCRKVINDCMMTMGFKLITYRLVPTDSSIPGHESKSVEPYIEQLFLVHEDDTMKSDDLERKLFVLGNYITNQINNCVQAANDEFYIASLSCNTLIYKGQLKTDQLRRYYHDLQNQGLTSALAIVHSRFSTNTFPNWKLAQPFRYIAHNGEINTIRGNVTKMRSKEALMQSEHFSPEEMSFLMPITDPDNSDSANLDSLVELLTLSGRSLPHVMMMLVPEAWQDNKQMDVNRKDFYKYHAAMMEPWDGPAALFFTNGKKIGATLDRNGLRPARYCITTDHRLIMASEAGAIATDESEIIKKGRLQPGKMLMADLSEGVIYDDTQIKSIVCDNRPYTKWLKEQRIKLRLLPIPDLKKKEINIHRLTTRQISNGMTEEDVKITILPFARTGAEPLGSMGSDVPLAVLSKQSQHISNYFKQYFAQVSNPPIDPIRERLVMSLYTRIGKSLNLLKESAEHSRQVHISQPILSRDDFYRIKGLTQYGMNYCIIDATLDITKKETLRMAIGKICNEAEDAINKGNSILIISNRKESKSKAAIPSLLATGSVHHHLVNKKLRTQAGIVVECSDAWETHHFATIIGYGASAIYPYLTYDTIQNAHENKVLDGDKPLNYYFENFRKGIGKGLLKILSKMGISTLHSYQSSQIFECVGLGQEVISTCFKGTVSRLDGLNFDDLEKEVLTKHLAGYNKSEHLLLEAGGYFQWKQKRRKAPT